MSSYSYTESATFTITHARHMAAKIATDLKRIQRLYGKPTDQTIADYEAEAVAMMKAGYLSSVTYGFKRDGSWIEPTLKYTARDLANSTANDDDPGKIRPGKDVSGASFTSFLAYSDAYFALPQSDRNSFNNGLPFQRTTGTEPPVSGYFASDHTYSAGGRALDRSCVRSY
ncbi:hypothetical protein A6U97_27600 [Agrobacterium tumefaciens]|jgi:hypothetical protein|uniref:HORMA-1 domain-containing protein n=1 Tax=Rhizobiaceae TaxID=82115 RepID=UPI00080FB439|nr:MULTISPECIES: hypothetical protein [Rhizobiaceae]MCO6181143.1 hypothetical protein [Ciceribacter sp. RN22]OCJ65489.1 hypothetical protein A6U97_27600 [Agrobacterium tumefaciens]PND26047.1 hypothetical protein CN933_17800 [Sinorhizobium sp. M4_45]